MNIGLIDVDGHNGFPNLALMKISAWHKQRGDNVEWHNPLYGYDIVYASKVFTYTPDIDYCINAEKVVYGGTGYKIYDDLPPEVDGMFPDYSIYPHYDKAIGFLTRGCIRNCPWCIVPRKEGNIRPYSTWQGIKRRDSRNIVFLDNNVLAHEHGLIQIADMAWKNVRVDFNQGLDARLIDKHVAGMLADLKWIKYIRLACDTSAMIPVIEQAVSYLGEQGVRPYRIFVYALVQDVSEAEHRVMALSKMGVQPFAQPFRDFDGGEPTKEQKAFARWVNNKAVFKTCSWSNYNRR